MNLRNKNKERKTEIISWTSTSILGPKKQIIKVYFSIWSVSVLGQYELLKVTKETRRPEKESLLIGILVQFNFLSKYHSRISYPAYSSK